MFYAGQGRWTKEPWNAQEFDSGELVVREARDQQLTDVEIVYIFPNPKDTITVPIHTP
jgi:hypothetical protein